MNTILIATNNVRKQEEIQEILADLPVVLVSPDDIEVRIEVAETGGTFSENAILKARAFAVAAGLPALSDDSGLEVEALDGAPGIHSARFGDLQSDRERNLLLLHRLQGIPDDMRAAEFVCVLALCLPDERVLTFEGRVQGTITRELRGDGGFGYDPLFLVKGTGKTYGELRPDQKNAISHRGRALRQLREWLATSAVGQDRICRE